MDEQQQHGQQQQQQHGQQQQTTERNERSLEFEPRTAFIMQEQPQVIVHSMQEVQRAPKRSALRSFSATSKETLFPDDPFRHFKNKSGGRKCVLGLQYVFPILEWLPAYKPKYFKNDLIAGVTIASLSIPQAIAYARLANLPPVLGLYTCVIPPLVYAIFGSSRDVAMGPEAVLSLLLGSLIRSELGDDVSEPRDHMELAFTATFFMGLFQALLGICRLGFVIDFLSHATTVGFMSGASLVVALQQFKGILGLTHFTVKSDIVSVVSSVFQHPSQWNWRTVVLGVCFISFLFGAKFISKRNKKLFWIAAVAPLTSVVVSTLAVSVSHVDRHRVGIVGVLKKGLNPPSTQYLSFHGPLLFKGVKIGAVLSLVGLMQVILVGRTFASLKNYHIDGNKEMIASGVVNLVGSCLSCFGSNAAMSRTAVNYNAGCKTSLSCIIMSIIVMVTLLALTPLFHYTPNVILSVIIFCALVGLIDPIAAYEIWKVDKIDFLACLGAFLGVIFHSIPLGLLVAVGISIGKMLLHLTRPQTAVLGRIPGTNLYRNVRQYPQATKAAGFLIIRVDSAIYFCNASYIRERVLRWIEMEGEHADKKPLMFLIMDLAAVSTIDTSGIYAMVEIHRILSLMNIQLVLVDPGADVLERLHRSGYVETLGQHWMFLSVEDAVQCCSMQLQLASEEPSRNDREVIVQILPQVHKTG